MTMSTEPCPCGALDCPRCYPYRSPDWGDIELPDWADEPDYYDTRSRAIWFGAED